MNTTQIQALRKTQAVLMSIANGAPKFFNVSVYENQLGLVKSVQNWELDSAGNKIVTGHSYQLTAKGQRILNTVI